MDAWKKEWKKKKIESNMAVGWIEMLYTVDQFYKVTNAQTTALGCI